MTADLVRFVYLVEYYFLLVAFVCGLAAGAAAMHWITRYREYLRRQAVEKHRPDFLEQLEEELSHPPSWWNAE